VVFTWDGTTLCEQTTTSPDLPNPVTITWNHQGLRPIAQNRTHQRSGRPAGGDQLPLLAIVTDLWHPHRTDRRTGRHRLAHTRTTLWGTTAWAANSTAYTPLRFPGQYFDPETGLHYNFFRHYDPRPPDT